MLKWRDTVSNILLPFELAGKPVTDEHVERAEEILELVGLAGCEDFFPNQLSGGMKKRVEIARALVMQPRVIILDEPMSGLDEVMKEIVTELILNMYDRGMTIILIEHDAQAVMELSHSIIVLDHGRKLAEGTPLEISRDERVAGVYLGARTS